jgi:hypothetical protein
MAQATQPGLHLGCAGSVALMRSTSFLNVPGPIHKVHRDEGWYLHQPTRCGKVVSTISWDAAISNGNPAVPALANAQRVASLSYHPILSFPPR